MSQQRFEQAMERMREGDVRSRDKAFDFLREHADAYVEELIAEFASEEDPELRCLLLELLAETRAEQTLDVFRGQLESTDETLRFWAIRGLEMLDTREAEEALRHARASGWLV
jgi:hypothetical protein